MGDWVWRRGWRGEHPQLGCSSLRLPREPLLIRSWDHEMNGGGGVGGGLCDLLALVQRGRGVRANCLQWGGGGGETRDLDVEEKCRSVVAYLLP